MALASVVIALFGAAGVAAAQDDEPEAIPPPVASVVLPDVIVQLDGSATDADARNDLVEQLAAAGSVAWASLDGTTGPGSRILVGFDDDRESVGLQSVEAIVANHELGPEAAIGGQAVTDAALVGRIGRALFVTVLLASLAIAVFSAWIVRPHHGALGGLAVAVAAWLGGLLGGRVVGEFDGSLVTTAVPAVLVSILVGAFLWFRLVLWFRQPEGEDLAEMIRRAAMSLAVEFGLLVAGLVLVALFLASIASGGAVAASVLVATIVAGVTTLALVAPVLAALHGSGLSVFAVGSAAEERWQNVREYLSTPPNGRDLPMLVVVGFGFFLGLLGLLALFGPTVPGLLDRSDLAETDDGASAAFVSDLVESGGDPTASIVASFAPGVGQQAKAAWLARVSAIADIGRVDAAGQRWVDGDPLDAEDQTVAALAELDGGTEAPTVALLVPLVDARGDDGRALVEQVLGSEVPDGVELSGAPIDATEAGERNRGDVWLAMLALAVVGGLAVYGLVGDVITAVLAGGLRLLDSTALVGLYHLVVGDVSAAELLVVVFVSTVGMGLFELGLVKSVIGATKLSDTDRIVEAALLREGWAAAASLAVVAVASLGLLGSGLGVANRVGIVLLVALAIEIVIGLSMLRAAALGSRAISRLAAGSVRGALRVLSGEDEENPEQTHGHWVPVVDALLRNEFRLQASPAHADIGSVFETGTDLFVQAQAHHQNLAGAGLRIQGRDPQLSELRVVTLSPRPTFVVTVDHPDRDLVDVDSRVVGVRQPERRSVMVWLDEGADGVYRIHDSVELGGLPITPAGTPPPAPDMAAGAVPSA
ncbi:MAG: hypothetical protein AAF467_16840 [Actinomycetota bacterium]